MTTLFAACSREESKLAFQEDQSDPVEEKLYSEVLPFVKERGRELLLDMKNGKNLRYAYYSKPENSATVLILPGYTEYIEKYYELIFDLSKSGLDVLVVDHVGMGKSTKDLENKKIVHIEKFSEYLDGVRELLDEVQVKNDLYLYGHSTGALIGSYLVKESPDMFKKVTYSSPLFKVLLKKNRRILSYLYLNLLKPFKSKSYAPGYEDCTTSDYPFENNAVTQSEARWNFNRDLLSKDPSLWMCGPSVNWVLQVLKATKKSSILEIAQKHEMPVLIFLAKNDVYMESARAHEFAEWAPDATLRVFEDSRHEIYREKEAIRTILINDLIEFFKKPN